MKTTLLSTLSAWIFSLSCPAATRVEDVPEKGLQPEVEVAKNGTVHLVYLRGEPKAAEVRYTWRNPGESWRPSHTVNSIAGSAVALGSIRGAQLALGDKGAVHVLWNGAGGQLWHARKTQEMGSFEDQRDLLGNATALDGGASIAADGRGGVFVVWHGNEAGAAVEEKQRLVFVRTSKDEGRTFGNAEPANGAAPGVCACCSLRASAGPADGLHIFFRNAARVDHRAMTLLSRAGTKWESREIDPWKIAACPMSSAALVVRENRLLGAWETAGQIRAGWIADAASPLITVAAKAAKHPVMTINSQRKILIAWVEGSGWNRGGSAGWQEFDMDLRPSGPRGHADGVPPWGRVAAYAEPQGDFVILR